MMFQNATNMQVAIDQGMVKGKYRLIRAVYEIKAVAVNGEFPGIPKDREYLPGTIKAVSYIVDSSIERLYAFTVSDKVTDELLSLGDLYRRRFTDRDFKTLETLEILC